MKRWASRMYCLLAYPKYTLDLIVSCVAFAWLGGYYFKTVLREYLAALPENPVPDRLLEAIPDFSQSFYHILDFFATNYIYVFGSVFMIYCIVKIPEKIPFILKTTFLLYFAKFIILPTTALTFPEGAIHETWDTIYNDLFFSGHTAFPFLLYLITRKDTKYLKYFFLFSTLTEATTVILMKIHYTIDVYAAPFIAFGVYSIAHNIFAKNYTAYDSLVTHPKRSGFHART